MTDFHHYLEEILKGNFREVEQEYFLDREAFTFPESQDQWQPPRYFIIENLKMDWYVDMEKAIIHAKNEMILASRIPNLKKITLHATELTIIQITDDNQIKLDFSYDQENQLLEIFLKKEYSEGANIFLTIEYQVKEPTMGGHFIRPNDAFPNIELQFWTHFQDDYARYIIPIYDHPSHKFPIELFATVPKGFYTISNGELVSRKENTNSTETFHWKQEQPIPSYLITLAIGKYEVYQEKLAELDILYLAEKKYDKETVYRSFGKTPKMIDFYNKKFGVKYPWKKYGQVTVSNFLIGGMENTSVTTITDYVFHDEKIHKDYTSEELVAHELVHQWIGDLITCKSWSHGWINEGGASQIENEWKKFDMGEDEYLYDQYGMQIIYFNEDKNNYRRPIVQTKWQYGLDLFDAHLYPGAAWRYYMLKHIVGEDCWWQVLGYLLTEHAYTSIETIDIQRAFEEITGNELDWFFDQWLYKAGYPELKIKCTYEEENKLVTVKVEQTQDFENTPKVFRFPFIVQLTNASGKKQLFTNEVTERIQTFYLKADFTPSMIEIDPNYSVLMDAIIEKPIEMWIKQLHTGSNVIMRIKAAQALGKKGTLKAITELNNALLKEPFWGVQVEIAKVLGSFKTNLALEGLLKATKVRNSKARTAIATALSNYYQNDKALTALEKMLEDNESNFVIAAAASSIGKIKHEKSFDILNKKLPSIESSWAEIIKRGYLIGLAETEKLEALDVLLSYFKVGINDYIRRNIIENIAQLGKKFKKERPEIKNLLEITLLNDKSHRVVRATINAIKNYEDASLIPVLEKLQKMTTNHNHRRGTKIAIRDLSKKKDSTEIKSLQKIIEELQKENREIRERLEKLEYKESI